MAPHDKSYYEGLPLIITDHPIGVHSIREEGEEFEVRLLPLPQPCHVDSSSKTSRFFGDVIKSKKQKKNRKGTKTVRFEKAADYREIPHKSDIAPEDKALLWNGYHDWNAMQNERLRITKAILSGKLTIKNQTEEMFLRGLENLVPTQAAKRRENIYNAHRHVLRAQGLAKAEGRAIDAESLALSYGRMTQESKEAAYNQGLHDYYQVLKDDGVRVLSAILI